MSVVRHGCSGFRSELYGFLCREGYAHRFYAFVMVRFCFMHAPPSLVSIFFPWLHLELLVEIFSSIVHLKWTGEEILLA